ncbi:hypothetical protein FKM82_016585 [Ascaphus truei]
MQLSNQHKPLECKKGIMIILSTFTHTHTHTHTQPSPYSETSNVLHQIYSTRINQHVLKILNLSTHNEDVTDLWIS